MTFSWRANALLAVLLFGGSASAAGDNPCLDCDREMRKTFDAIQAWRRLHHGRYPDRLVDLKQAGLLPSDRAICPDVLRERIGGNAAHREVSSRSEAGDPQGTYEYELSAKVLKSGGERIYLPSNAPSYTRQDVKAELLRRPFFEQIPILRCSSHRAVAPPPFAGADDVRRNATVAGSIYWSRTFWEHLWLNDVPYCARDANVLFGLKGPPFYTDRTPVLPEALDLRKWNCAFGDHAWWWTYPMFEEGVNRQTAAHLRPFFEENHGRSIKVAGTQWWIDGLVQLQGQVLPSGRNHYSAPGMEAFVWQKTGVSVNRTIRGASWLQGTVWVGRNDEPAGWLVWKYADGAEERVPVIYGKTTARFWGDAKQIEGESGFPDPVWKHHETTEAVGKERWLRLYQQHWTNPRPDIIVTILDFVSNRESPAAPFIIAVNVTP